MPTSLRRTLVRATVLVGLLLCAAVVVPTTGCGGGATPVEKATTATGLPAIDDFTLVEVPFESQVRFTADSVIWLVPPADVDRMGPWPDVDVMSFDIAGGTTSIDEWLTAMLSGRAIHEWKLVEDRLTWIDGSKRVESSHDGSVYILMRVYTAVRGDSSGVAISPRAWGVSGDTGGYEPAVYRLDCNSTLVSWYGGRNTLLNDLSGTREIDPARLWVWDAGDGRRDLPAPSAADDFLALGGRRVFTGAGLSAASDFGTRTIHVWDADASVRSVIRLQERAAAPAAADESTLIWTVVPENATDFAEADLAGCDVDSGEVFTISAALGGQTAPAVDGDLVAWVDTPPGAYSPLPDGSFPLDTLHGMRLSTRAESTFVADPFRSASTDAQFLEVTLIGDRVFWTIRRAGACTAYGARVITAGDGLTVEPLRD